jgi:ParB family chromosome partitioning protein
MHNKDCEYLPIEKIKISAGHLRKRAGNVDRLKSTISDVGLLQPILVRKADDQYVVVDGERRLQAMKELAIPELIIGREVIVDVEETDADLRFKQIIANVQREDINHFDLGHAFVILKEKYGYQYREIAEIIGRTPHYVTSKVGLVKRLTPQVQEMAADDWEEAKCIRDTSCWEENDDPAAYEMSVKIIEDIARLPESMQKMAYISIKSKEMDNDHALRFLRSLKKRYAESGELVQADEACLEGIEDSAEPALSKYVDKIDRDIEALAGRLRSADRISRQDLVRKLESSLDKLNSLYSRLRGDASAAERADRSGVQV